MRICARELRGSGSPAHTHPLILVLRAAPRSTCWPHRLSSAPLHLLLCSAAFHMLADHFPERMASVVMLEAPAIFYGAWREGCCTDGLQAAVGCPTARRVGKQASAQAAPCALPSPCPPPCPRRRHLEGGGAVHRPVSALFSVGDPAVPLLSCPPALPSCLRRTLVPPCLPTHPRTHPLFSSPAPSAAPPARTSTS